MESKEGHSVSLKVLRLSRPSLAQQQPLLPSAHFDPKASLANPELSEERSFMLTPMLTLPLAFGSAYVGETFECTLCINNELTGDAGRTITSVKLAAEMQTPSQTITLPMGQEHERAAQDGLQYGESLQTIVRFDLREDGSHTLVVSVSYNESIHSKEQTVSGGRVRSFRKLYQFIASPCLSVRTKASELQESLQPGEKDALEHYILEAQLENLADGIISIESLSFEPRLPFESTSLNWDSEYLDQPSLTPREVTQVAFLVKEQTSEGIGEVKKETTRDGRKILGVLTIRWRSEMGQAGVLSTGWLTTRKK